MAETYHRRPKMRKFKKGTPILDRVEPLLKEQGIDTSTLKVVRFGAGVFYELVIEDRVIGSYNGRSDILQIHDLPAE